MSGPRRCPAVFLDRDNTIIRNDGDLGDPDAVELIQGAAMAIASLCGLGFKVVVVTNQGGVARGKYTEEDVDAVHDRLREEVERAANGARIEAFYFCPYHPQGTVKRYKREHEDRKPQPGMLLRAAADHHLDLSCSWMVGDQPRDVEAGVAAGCRTVWLHDGEAALQPDDAAAQPDYTVRSLVEAVRIIASQRHARDEAHPPARSTGRRFDAQAMTELQKPRDTSPTEESDDQQPRADAGRNDGGSVSSPRAAARPFRPFDLPPEEKTGTESVAAAPPRLRLAQMVEKVKSVSAAARANPQPPAPAPREPSGGLHPDPKTEPTPGVVSLAVTDDKPEREPDTGAVKSDEDATDAEPVAVPRSASSPETDPTEPATATPIVAPPAQQDKVLRLILQELRGQRGVHAQAGPVTLIALVFQAISAVCLLAGLWAGSGDDGLFIRWLGVALIVQLGVIALLLFGRSGR